MAIFVILHSFLKLKSEISVQLFQNFRVFFEDDEDENEEES